MVPGWPGTETSATRIVVNHCTLPILNASAACIDGTPNVYRKLKNTRLPFTTAAVIPACFLQLRGYHTHPWKIRSALPYMSKIPSCNKTSYDIHAHTDLIFWVCMLEPLCHPWVCMTFRNPSIIV